MLLLFSSCWWCHGVTRPDPDDGGRPPWAGRVNLGAALHWQWWKADDALLKYWRLGISISLILFSLSIWIYYSISYIRVSNIHWQRSSSVLSRGIWTTQSTVRYVPDRDIYVRTMPSLDNSIIMLTVDWQTIDYWVLIKYPHNAEPINNCRKNCKSLWQSTQTLVHVYNWASFPIF